tara:strand:+ start:626 stop:1345 length:720 start_codon:yes stop_codon:yes gene_type:complete
MHEFNIYKVKDKSDNNHEEMPLFDLPMRLLINGKSQLSGKTTMILNLLMNPEFGYDKKFEGENIYIISDNKLDNKIKILMEYKDIPPENHFPYDEQVLEMLYENLEEEAVEQMEDDGKIKPKLIIMDDVGYSGNLKSKNFGMITKLVANGRHLNLSQIYTSQRFSMVSTSLRSNLTGAILFNTSMKELELIAEDFNYKKTKKSFMEMFRKETDKPRSFLVINFSNKSGLYMNSKFQTIS